MIDPQLLRRAVEHHQAGRHTEAEAAYRVCLAQDPGNAGVWSNFAVLAVSQRAWQTALERAQHAALLAPGNPTIQCNIAFALTGLGREVEARDLCLRVLQVKSDCAPAWFGLGEAQARLGEEEEAIAAYRAALESLPNYAAAANNLGNLLTNRNDFDGAVAAFQRALEITPSSAAAHHNLGGALRELGRHSEALMHFRRALELEPHLAPAHSSLILALHYIPGVTGETLAEEKKRWWQQHGAPSLPTALSFPNNRDPDRPLRIGYVSADFRDHPVGRHLFPLLREHDRQNFHITAYSGVRVPDACTKRFQMLDIGWRHIAFLDDGALANLIRTDAIDILVDLSLHSAGDRLPVFARQPAPLQISFAGYPGDTGLESIAYHLTDRVLEPIPARGALYLADSFWCMDPLEDAPAVNHLPALSRTPFVFGCLHKFAKANEPLLELWCEILRRLPRARLLMLCPPGDTRGRLHAVFQHHGIAPERIELTSFLRRPDYLALHGRIDLILDTVPYSGHMTAMDALWMGVPFVTLPGELPVSRGGASLLTQVDLSEFIASTPEQYVEFAVAFAMDRPRLAALRASLRARMKASPLMDATRFARSVEAAWRTAWRQWCASATQPPAALLPKS